jgi:hypothetical protein
MERLAPEISRRVRAILEVAEREAESLRAEAREEARRVTEDARRRADELVAERRRRVSELSDALIARLEALLQGIEAAEEARVAFDGLVRALGEAAEGIAGEASDPGRRAAERERPVRPTPRPEQRTAPPPPGPEERTAPPPPRADAERDRRADGAQIVAIQMAAAGRTRAQTGSHIRDSLGIDDPASVLDEVFGEGTPDDATVAWAKPRPGV